MYRTTVRFGRSGSAVAALSAVDLACWDLHRRAEGQPVYDLVGGLPQTRVPCYASRLYVLGDLDELALEARGYVAAGFARLKQRFGLGPRDGAAGMRRNVELVRTVREAVGEDVELAADAYPNVEPDTGNELFWKLFRGHPEAQAGFLEPPTGPGLGVTLDEEVAAELQIGETTATELPR